MAVISMPKILREKLTDEGAEAIVELLNDFESHSKDNTLEIAEERFEKRAYQIESKIEIAGERFERRLVTEIAKIETKIAETEARLETKIAETENRIDTKIGNIKTDLIKWMVGLLVGQTAILLTILALFLNK